MKLKPINRNTHLYLINNIKPLISKQSQSSMEFISITVALIFLFVLLFASISENMGEKVSEKNNLEVKEVAYIIQDEINLASISSEGYTRQFKVPDNVYGEDYSINVVADTVYVKSNDEKNAIALPIPKITGNIVKGNNTIKKQNGEIYLNP